MSITLAPDDIVRTRAEIAPDAREPLLVMEPLVEFLAANGLPADELTAEPEIGRAHV